MSAYKNHIITKYIKLSNLDISTSNISWGRTLNKNDQKTIYVEDGFIRSNGLGCNFFYPYSLVFDRIGIYFDSTRPSEFETIVNQSSEIFSSNNLKETTNNLINFIKNNNITKYEQGTKQTIIDKRTQRKITEVCKQNQKVILIPSQVPNDNSLIYGGCGYTIEKLVLQVRKENPNAYIIFKEHPDVLFGHRPGKLGNSIIREQVDYICSDKTSILTLINLANEIHTISSLAGFDALIRNKKVICYGMPFYAGWGLTDDKYTCHRRIARPTLEEFIACALIRYPTYFDWNTMQPSNALDICKRLIQGPSKRNRFLYSLGFVFRFLRWIGICK